MVLRLDGRLKGLSSIHELSIRKSLKGNDSRPPVLIFQAGNRDPFFLDRMCKFSCRKVNAHMVDFFLSDRRREENEVSGLQCRLGNPLENRQGGLVASGVGQIKVKDNPIDKPYET